jgi:hypothetical protein
MSGMIQRRKVQRAFHGMVGLPPEPDEKPVVSSPPASVVTEDEARKMFGVEKPESKSSALVKNMRQTLMLEPEDLIALFDESPATKVGEQMVFGQADFLLPPPMLQHRINRLKKIIARSKDIIEGLSARVMKLRRGKEKVLNKATREKFKRDENGRIVRSNAKLSRYRTALRLGNYREKIWCWQVKPIYFHEVVEDCMTFTDYGETYYERGELKLPKDGAGYYTTNLVRDIIATRIFDVSRYEVMMQLDADALQLAGASEEEQRRTWANRQRWENAVIKAAVFHGVLRPRRDLLELLALTAFAQAASRVTEHIEADETENALALKTGGACYGASIQSAGYRYNTRTGRSRRRALESFDKSKPPADWDEGGQQARDTGSDLYHVQDDAESYDPR